MSSNTLPFGRGCCDKIFLHPLNAQTVYLWGLVTIIQGSDPPQTTPVAAAMLEGTLVDGEGNDVAGFIDVPFLPIGSPPNGDYAGQITGQSFDPPLGPGYILVIDGTNGPDEFHAEIPVEVEPRSRPDVTSVTE